MSYETIRYAARVLVGFADVDEDGFSGLVRAAGVLE